MTDDALHTTHGGAWTRGRATTAGALVIATALATWAFVLEPASLANEDHFLEVPAWPAACGETRIALLADLHTGSPWNGLEKLDEIIDTTLAAEPDLVLLAGDYVIHGVLGGRPVPLDQVASRLARLSAPLGVYAVLGNHDWWFGAAAVREALETAGIVVLQNDAVRTGAGDCRFWIAGIDDFMVDAHDVERALRPVPPGKALLALTHNPDVFPEIPSRVALTLAGHTHGGQVYLPGVGRPIVPSRYGARYALGSVVEDGRHLFVSSGLGTSILPVRFLVPPEVTVLHVRRDGWPSSDGSGTIALVRENRGEVER